jgi:hypothetical protein
MKLRVLDDWLWLAGFVGHMILLLILIFRKRLKSFYALAFYIGFEALTTVALFVISRFGSHREYFLAYWITGFADFPLQLWIIGSLARDVFRPVRAVVGDIRRRVWRWGALGVVTAATLSFGMGGASGAKGFDLWENRTSIFTSLIVCGVIVVVSSVSQSFGIPQGRHSVALEQGLFVWLYSILLSDVAHAVVGWNRGTDIIEYARSLLYLGVLVCCYSRERADEKHFAGLRERVLARDGHTCQGCRASSISTVLAVHHRQPGVSSLDLLVTLCPACHAVVERTEVLFRDVPELLRVLWRELHPEASEQPTPQNIFTYAQI